MEKIDNAYLKSVRETFQELFSSEKGLDEEEAQQRLKTFGLNQIGRERKLTPVSIFLKQFRSPLVYILVIAGVLSSILGERLDSLVIWIAITIDVLVGFFQEYKASNTLGKLLGKTVYSTIVLRSGKQRLLDSTSLVPGDVILLKSGDKIPADSRIIKQKNLEVDESLLTGESFPRKKISSVLGKERVLAERDNMLYMGTSILSGYCQAIVTSTGDTTELGQISETIREQKEEKTLIQKELENLARFIGVALITILSIIFFVGVIRTHEWAKMFSESVALAVSALPEGLPVAVTIIFAIGMQKVLKKKGLIRNLLATETLGRTEVLCIDKTGTLTEGKMNVTQISFLDKKRLSINDLDVYSSPTTIEILKSATLCNQAFTEKGKKKIYRGNATDVALLKFGHKFNLSKKSIDKKNSILDDFPFDPRAKLSAALVKNGKKNRMYICGSPEKIIDNSSFVSTYKTVNTRRMAKRERTTLFAENDYLSTKGFRIIAVAYKDVSEKQRSIKNEFLELTFLGLVVIDDPLRESSKEAVQETEEAGLRLVIVTGDQVKTALNIAKQVGMPCERCNILKGEKLNKLSDKQLDEVISDISLFVRVAPNDKVRIIKSLQRKGKVVAMTGDGINDAPALHLADIGIALGSGTDVAKESADLVLMDDNLRTILDTIREGRGILDNIKKVAIYLLSDSLAEVIIVAFAIFLGWPLPIIASQILWINLVEDGLPDIALSVEPIERNILKLPPKIFQKPILDLELKLFTLIIGWIDDIALIGLFVYYYVNGFDIEFIRTMIFAALTIDSLFFVYACKSLREPLWKIRILNNKLLNISFIIGAILLVSAIYLPPLQTLLQTVPLSFNYWIVLIGVGLLDLLALEITKEILILRRARKKHKEMKNKELKVKD
ncbi:cation-transporting P-type ATPase [Candidatus Dojkabacteria bacterium]|nr:cation-transporting P-type ATPase [Candidatus Dojkabacteria bacterium]